MADTDLVEMTIEVVASYVAHNNLRPDDVAGFITATHAAIVGLTKVEEPMVEAAPEAPEHQPAVSVRKSLASPEHIISMIDGKHYKTLKRHVARHGMTPAEYRERYGLKADYPMTAPAYSEHRRQVAKTLGLGRKPSSEQPVPEPEAPAAQAAPQPEAPVMQAEEAAPPKKRGRPAKLRAVFANE